MKSLTELKEDVGQARETANRRAEKRAERGNTFATNERAIMGEVRLIGGALVTILVIALVLSEIYAAVDVGDGPFSSIVDDLETTGVAAISLLIVGLLVLAATAIMRLFGSGGFGTR